MYQGNWAKGLREGYGVFYYANGAKYEGFWKDNMKEGFAFYTNENGNISLTLFCKDRMIKQNSKLAVTAPISAPLTTSGPLGKTTLKIEA